MAYYHPAEEHWDQGMPYTLSLSHPEPIKLRYVKAPAAAVLHGYASQLVSRILYLNVARLRLGLL
jgi:hypothetical protein